MRDERPKGWVTELQRKQKIERDKIRIRARNIFNGGCNLENALFFLSLIRRTNQANKEARIMLLRSRGRPSPELK